MTRGWGRVGRLLVVGCSIVVALMGTAWAERLPIKAYTAADGLAHDRVTCVVSDSRGFLWFCTAEGLSRFDGHTFSTDLVPRLVPDAGINDFLETSRGLYWVATNGRGVQRINRSVRSDFSVGDVPETNRVNVLYEDRDGQLWAGTDGGLFFLDPSVNEVTFRPVPLVPWKRDDLHKSRSGAPGSQGATTENIGHI